MKSVINTNDNWFRGFAVCCLSQQRNGLTTMVKNGYLEQQLVIACVHDFLTLVAAVKRC